MPARFFARDDASGAIECKPAHFVFLGGLLAALAVGLGAYRCSCPERAPNAQHLEDVSHGGPLPDGHAIGVILVGLLGLHSRSRMFDLAGWAMLAGIVLFSGFLYAWLVTGRRFFVYPVPVGGIAFIVGWMLLAIVRSLGTEVRLGFNAPLAGLTERTQTMLIESRRSYGDCRCVDRVPWLAADPVDLAVTACSTSGQTLRLVKEPSPTYKCSSPRGARGAAVARFGLQYANHNECHLLSRQQGQAGSRQAQKAINLGQPTHKGWAKSGASPMKPLPHSPLCASRRVSFSGPTSSARVETRERCCLGHASERRISQSREMPEGESRLP